MTRATADKLKAWFGTPLVTDHSDCADVLGAVATELEAWASPRHHKITLLERMRSAAARARAMERYLRGLP